MRRSTREGCALPESALIGFCGAPWTVATYMVAGQGTPDQAPARMMAYRHPDVFPRPSSIGWSRIRSSIFPSNSRPAPTCVQIFDTWAGVLPPRNLSAGRSSRSERIVAGAARAQSGRCKIIGFPRGAGALAAAYATRPAPMPSASTGPPSHPLIRERSAEPRRFRAISILWR